MMIAIGFATAVGTSSETLAAVPEAINSTLKSPLNVRVQLLSGESAEGRLIKCQGSELMLSTQIGQKWEEKKIVTADIAILTVLDPASYAVSPGYDVVRLSDGTTIHCRSITSKGSEWIIESESSIDLKVAPSMLSLLQFRGISKAVRESTDKILTALRPTDEMLIVRPGDTIDKVPGVILGLDENAASFSFDGQTIPAPRAKLAGLAWAQPEEATFQPTIRIRTVDGSKWEATELSYSFVSGESASGPGESAVGFRWKLRCGAECFCEPTQIQSIDYSNAIVRWLAAMSLLESKPDDNPFLSSPISGRAGLLAPYFTGIESTSETSIEPSTQNLCFPVNGEVVARVPEKTSRFRTRIIRPEDAKVEGSIRCEIWSNDAIVWSSSDLPKDSPWVVDVAVVPEKRIRMLVRSKSGLSLGSMVTWLQPRFSP